MLHKILITSEPYMKVVNGLLTMVQDVALIYSRLNTNIRYCIKVEEPFEKMETILFTGSTYPMHLWDEIIECRPNYVIERVG